MKLNNYFLLMDENTDDNGGGAGGADDIPKEAPPASGAKDDKAPAEEGSEFDDFGYPVEKTPDQSGKEGAKTGKEKDEKGDLPKPKEEEIKDPASGYAVEPKVEEEPEETPEEKKDPPTEDPNKLEFELDLKNLDTKDADELKAFAKKHGLSKEQAQAVVDQRKADISARAQRREERIKTLEKEREKLKSAWYNELKADKDFGGANFAHNVNQVEKLMSDFLPEVKKELTENKNMLPPNVMRGLHRIAKAIHGTEKLIDGEPAGVKEDKEKDDSDNPLSFYV